MVLVFRNLLNSSLISILAVFACLNQAQADVEFAYADGLNRFQAEVEKSSGAGAEKLGFGLGYVFGLQGLLMDSTDIIKVKLNGGLAAKYDAYGKTGDLALRVNVKLAKGSRKGPFYILPGIAIDVDKGLQDSDAGVMRHSDLAFELEGGLAFSGAGVVEYCPTQTQGQLDIETKCTPYAVLLGPKVRTEATISQYGEGAGILGGGQLTLSADRILFNTEVMHSIWGDSWGGKKLGGKTELRIRIKSGFNLFVDSEVVRLSGAKLDSNLPGEQIDTWRLTSGVSLTDWVNELIGD